MACPYFEPLEPFESGRGLPLPLGDAYSGVCHAGGGRAVPDPNLLTRNCNLGYASGCPRFPNDGGPDAARYCIRGERNGIVRLSWVLERNHHPFGHGTLEYSRRTRSFTVPHASVLLTRQAQAYVESYLRRRRSEVE